jgi:ATP-dependent RNA helicase DDX27
MTDYVMTIDSDSEETTPPKITKSPKQEAEDASLNPDFIFDVSGDPYTDMVGNHADLVDFVKMGTKPVCLTYKCVFHGIDS